MRVVRRIAVCLVLGAITTIAAAWGSPIMRGWRLSRISAPSVWSAELMADAAEREALFAADSAPSTLMHYHPPVQFLKTVGEKYGWPLRALTTERPFYRMEPWRAAKSYSYDSGWEVPNPFLSAGPGFAPSEADSIVLPVRPIWWAFLLDTALFGCAWAAPLFGVSALRRALRRRRGQCPRCAYDLKGLGAGAKCPECGAGARR